jgi:hypothetical protein
LESLVAATPLEVQLKADGLPRLKEPLEVAAYYVVCENLTNAVNMRRPIAYRSRWHPSITR